MTDNPTARGLMRKQQLGTNNNTWGDTLLNLVFDLIDRWVGGWQTYTVSGSATLNWTNYSTTNDFLTANVKLSGPSGDGTLTSAASIMIPSVEFRNKIWNATGQTITVKYAADTGIAIPNGGRIDLAGNGSVTYNQSPNQLPGDIVGGGDLTIAGAITMSGQLHGLAAGSANTDAVNVTQMSAAIATASLPGTPGTFRNSVLDTTSGYNTDKNTMSSDSLLVYETQNAAGNENQRLSDRRLRRRLFFVGQV